MMQLEVELKYRVADPRQFEQALRQLGVEAGEPVLQIDRYFQHPVRDFGQTDEALRIRSIGPKSWVTYKGPRIDTATKTRRELELPLAGTLDDTEAFGEMLQALSFRPVLRVQKSRRKARLHWQQFEVEIVLDAVEGLGDFTELEIVVTDSEQLQLAQQAVLSLAEQLQLAEPEMRSYLEMLLEKPAL